MTNRTTETSPLMVARVAGWLYLSLIPLGVFGILYVPATLIVPGVAAATSQNIMASESLFRLSIVSALMVQLELGSEHNAHSKIRENGNFYLSTLNHLHPPASLNFRLYA